MAPPFLIESSRNSFSRDSSRPHTPHVENSLLDGDSSDPVAIIGFDFTFPGEAVSEDSLWDMLINGKVDPARLPGDRFTPGSSSNDEATAWTSSTARAHFIDENIAAFDASFFFITPTEAMGMDPQQRKLLETAYKALENAGVPMESLRGSNTSVHVGCFTSDYNLVQCKDAEVMPTYHATGNSGAILSNRISWFFDLKGPSVTMDTACSSSLVALDQACQTLRAGQSTMGIVGGCNVICTPESIDTIGRMRFLSPDGQCHCFDEQASGYARAEGFGVLVLKRLSEAIKNGDTIRAIIRATGTNQDGRTISLAQPNAVAQVDLLRSVYKDAKLDLRLTRFVEAHGTGTAVGDPIEANSLGQAFDHIRNAGDPVFVGATKANIGHLEACSGIAGIIKSILVLERGVIPPIAQLQQINPNIRAENLAASIRRASVQSFGFGGTNAHAVLDDAYNYLRLRGLKANHRTILPSNTQQVRKDSVTESEMYKLLVWYAPDKAGLQRLTTEYHKHFKDRQARESLSTEYLDNVAYTLCERRSIQPWRTFTVVGIEGSQSFHSKPLDPVLAMNDRKLGVIFTGQGAQWLGMGRELMTYSVFQESIVRCHDYLQQLRCRWSLLDVFHASNTVNVDDAEVSQTLCTAMQIALVDMLRSFGVAPRVVVGHSSGEIAAAYCIGAISLPAAMKLAYYRGALANKLRDEKSSSGSMMSVGLSPDGIAPYLHELGTRFGTCRVSIGCINSPTSVTLSGETSQIDVLRVMIQEHNEFARVLKVPVAYHSVQMGQIASEYRSLIQEIEHGAERTGHCSMVSSVTGSIVSVRQLRQAEYWVKNLTSPVRFSDAISRVLAAKSNVGAQALDTIHSFLEIGPHSTLQAPLQSILKQTAPDMDVTYHSLLIRFKSAIQTMLQAVGELYCAGHSVQLSRVNDLRGAGEYEVLTSLPSYPFDHSTTYWAESRISKGIRFRTHGRNDLLGFPVADWNPFEPRWSLKTRLDKLPFIEDHVINNTLIYPAAGMISAVLEGARQLSEDKELAGFEVKDAEFTTALIASNNSNEVEIELRFRCLSGKTSSDLNRDAYEFRLYSYQESAWTKHCQGQIRIEFAGNESLHLDGGRSASEVHRDSIYTHQSTVSEAIKYLDTHHLYQDVFKSFGYTYGPTFQLLQDLCCDDANRATASLVPQSGNAKAHSAIRQPHLVHPPSLDAILQLALVAASKGGESPIPTIVPERIRRLWISATGLPIPNEELIYASAESVMRSGRKMEASASAFCNTTNQVLVHIDKFEGTAISSTTIETKQYGMRIPHFCFQMKWKPDIDLLDAQQLVDLCWDGNKLATSEQSLIEFEREVTVIIFHALFSAKEKITRQAIEPAKPYLSKYIRWMESQIRAFLANKYPEIRSRYNIIVLDLEKLADVYNLARNHKMWAFYAAVAENLVDIISGKLDPLQLFFGQNYATDFYAEANRYSRCSPAMQNYIFLLAHKHPGLQYFEVGAGTGSSTRIALDALEAEGNEDRNGSEDRFSSYEFTDISPSLVALAQESFGSKHPKMKFSVYDLEKAPKEQGYKIYSYDVVIAGSVLHATANITTTLKHVRSLLKPGGKLVLHENIRPDHVRMGFAFGLLPGWWLGTEDYRQHSPCLTPDRWRQALLENGFSGIDVEFRDFVSEECHEISVMISTAIDPITSPQMPLSAKVYWPFVIADVYDPAQLALAESIRTQLQVKHNLGCIIGSLEALSSSTKVNGRPCVILNESMPPASEKRFFAIQHLLASASHIVWYTHKINAQLDESPTKGLINGLARVVRRENNSLSMATVTSNRVPPFELGQADNIVKVLSRMLRTTDHEPEYLETEDGILEINRVFEAPLINTKIAQQLLGRDDRARCLSEQPLKLDLRGDGLLANLKYTEDGDFSKPLRPDEIEIEVKATGCNFMDALIAIGRLDAPSIGLEVAGVVSRIGSSVPGSMLGDKVVAFALDSYRSFVRTTACLAVPLPANLSFIQGASLPINFGTAYRALVDVAHLSTGETVLIHSAAGGTGQAAIQIAQHIGAKIFATVGSSKKKDLLIEKYGILADHIYSSRDDSFLGIIKSYTGNRGVDVVLNSLAGELLDASWECVAPYGRFIEIGKKDIRERSKIDMSPFANNVTFAAVDLEAMIRQRPELMGRLLRRVSELVMQGSLKPVNIHTFGADDVEGALRFLTSGESTGKVVVQFEKDVIVEATTGIKQNYSLAGDATYVIAGGLGGLGKNISRWMVRRGAQNLLLLNRSGVADDPTMRFVEDLRVLGCHVEAPPCDIGNSAALARVLEDCMSRMPPIRGCIQASMVLKDSTFDNMSYTDFNVPLKSKVNGSWNLHSLIPEPLDFFIMLSSVGGIFGSGGQANYAAANTYQDELAQHRVSLGRKAIAIDLGMMLGEGYLAQDPENMERLAKTDGLQHMPQDALIALLEHYCDPSLMDQEPQLITGLGIPATFAARDIELPWWMSQPMFRNLHQISCDEDIPSKVRSPAEAAIDFAQAFQTAAIPEQRIRLVKDALVSRLNHVMPRTFGDENEMKGKSKLPLHSLGVDSLVAVELRNWFAKEIGADIATFEILGNFSVDDLAALAVSKSRLCMVN
ncbi:hypothetical protein CC78DRAFT_595404 [Lojkania enalia]|uniref:Polyketide synthase n=1 Tax=Lojkania enalia TaxID=147567 RepID=A0A9P4KCJ1_9PLEO|nr:hypothetical protein CC78DRAFT_595404 [Didymosphaeria enalia]